jgi:hypothetical protein
MKKVNKKRKYVRNNPVTITEIPVEKVYANNSSINEKEMKKCAYYRENHCILRDDKCLPSSVKCINNKKAYMSTMSVTPSMQSDVKRKTYKNPKSYHPFTDERYGMNQKITVLNDFGKGVVLHVFKGFLNVSKVYTTDYKLTVKDFRTGQKYNIMVAYNKKTNRYYISDTQLKWLYKQNIHPDVIFSACNDGSVPLVTVDFQEFSKLALYGYSVGKNGLKTADRRKILKHIIDNKIMKRYEIVEHLQGLISLREERTDKDFSAAISNWREDIQFVNDY